MHEQNRVTPLSATERATLDRIESELWPEPIDRIVDAARPSRSDWGYQLLGVVSISFAALVAGVLLASAPAWRSIIYELVMVSVAFTIGLIVTIDPLRRTVESAVGGAGARLVGRAGGHRSRR